MYTFRLTLVLIAVMFSSIAVLRVAPAQVAHSAPVVVDPQVIDRFWATAVAQHLRACHDVAIGAMAQDTLTDFRLYTNAIMLCTRSELLLRQAVHDSQAHLLPTLAPLPSHTPE